MSREGGLTSSPTSSTRSARQLSRKTAWTYRTILHRCQRWCEAAGTNIDALTPKALEEFVGTVPATHASRVQLRSALIHYYAMNGRPDPPTFIVRVPVRSA